MNYFGEKAPDYCGHCDTCLNKPELQDSTIIAQKILSTVSRIKQGFGARYVVDILRGSNNEKIREEHKKLSVYGIGKDKPKEEWMHYVKELLHYDYLKQSSGEYPILLLTDKSQAVLFQNEKVFLTAPVQVTITKEPVIYQPHAYEKPLFEYLKKLRNQLAHEENVPAYLIFSDSTLLDLATYLPQSSDDLQHISGFGAFKIEKYGRAFLELVQDYCLENGLATQMDLKSVKKVRKSAAPRERASDTKKVSFDMFRSGNSLEEIAEIRQLSVSTIETHLSYYITTGELDINEIVSEDKQELIAQAMQKFGRLGLRQLKDNLPEEISYGEIKMMAAYAGR